jgi:hypothetical protein
MSMTLVSTVTVGSGGAANIDFGSIPQTGTDLLIVASIRNTSTGSLLATRFNGDSSTSWQMIRLYGDGSTRVSDAPSNTYLYAPLNTSSSTDNTFNNVSIYIPNYAGSSQKSVSVDAVTENNATAAQQVILAGLWPNTAAITSISLFNNANQTLAEHSTASLYLITKGSGGASVA